jgi:outer membrane protein OmpA-like peptidoglycan-associated protein/tetratricopeptide (TPR) repeat protein
MDIFRRFALTSFVLVFGSQLIAGDNHSTKPDNKIARKADNLFIFCDYKNALPIYEKLIVSSPENAQYNYRLGVCYYYSGTDLLKCLPYFEKARKNFNEENEEAIDLYYYLGTTYHMLNRFDDAIECYTRLKTFILPDKQGQQDIKDLDNQIAACNRGKEVIQHPSNVTITDLGPNVNSEYADYAPVISNDLSMMMFTSKRKESTGGRTDEDGNYYEDVFISRKINDGDDWQVSERLDSAENVQRISIPFLFSKSKVLGNSINTKEHDASVALSPDGKQLYIYRLDDVWVSDYKNNKWGKPSKLNNFINSKKDHEPSVSLTMDEKTLYFVSEREGGYGGKDIYSSEKLNDGTWGEPHNLGPVINTEYDEDAPFIDPENKILYFSSEAHGSIGGFDIFRSALENNNWSTPISLGYPVNSGANDIFYVYNSRNKTAYFSSLREGGKGNYDIYLADYSINKIRMRPVVTLNNRPTADPALIEVIQSNQPGGSGNISTDSYVPGETYTMNITTPLSEKHSVQFTVPQNVSSENYYQEIAFEGIIDEEGKISGYRTILYNAFFDLDSAVRNSEFAKISDRTEAYSAYLSSVRNAGIPGLIIAVNEEVPGAITTSVTNVKIPVSFVLFEYAVDNISGGSELELKEVLDHLKANENLKLRITGHSDSKGDENYNQKLSEKRALKIKEYFVSKGISDERITCEGKGETNPVAPNENPDGSDNSEGRKLNRRVEFMMPGN